MSVFLEYEVQLSQKQYSCSAWCQVDSILAVASRGGEIKFFGDEGYPLTQSTHARKSRVAKMEWQPMGKILAVGWMDGASELLHASVTCTGALTMWNAKENSSYEVPSNHRHPICLLVWSPYGNRIFTADESGLFVAWKIDIRGNIAQCAAYRRRGAITHCVFCTSELQRERIQRA